VEGKDIIFPMVVVRSQYGSNVDSHEQGHDQNALFQKAMFKVTSHINGAKVDTSEGISAKAKYIATWGALRTIDSEKVSLLKTEGYSRDTEGSVLEAMDWSVAYACSCAKDELLADYMGSLKAGELPMNSHYESVKNNPLYDYFKRHLGLDENSDTYTAVKDRYFEVLEYNVEPTMEVINRYQKVGWGQRAISMRNVLVQIPIEKWAKTMKSDLFEMESKLAEECFEYQQLIEQYLGNMNMDFITMSGGEAAPQVVEHYTTKEDAGKFKEIQEEYEELQDRFSEIKSVANSTTPMLTPLVELLDQSTALLQKAQDTFESSDTYQYKKAFERLLERFPETTRQRMRSMLTYDLTYSEKSFYGTLTHFQAKYKYLL